MTRYLSELQLAPHAFSAMIKNPHDRAEVIRGLYEALGGKLEAYYWAVGQSTVYTVEQMPDEVTHEALTMAVMAGGTVASIKCTAILTSAEVVAAMKKAATIGYKPLSQ